MNDWKTRFREIIYKYNRNTDDSMSFVDVTLMRDLEQFIQLTIEETEKAYGGCHKCFGKGYATQILGTTTSSDFPDYEPVKRHTKMKTHMNFCTCDRGKQLETLLKEGK